MHRRNDLGETKHSSSEFVNDVLFEIIAGRGDALPVSAMPCDGTFPTATTSYEKRNLAAEIPVWDPVACIQCGKCAMVCPHAAIRIKAYDESDRRTHRRRSSRSSPLTRTGPGMAYTIQVAPEDCTGCAICVDVCPAKSKTVDEPQGHSTCSRRRRYATPEKENWEFFLDSPSSIARS